jgi:hypothetical protein
MTLESPNPADNNQPETNTSPESKKQTRSAQEKVPLAPTKPQPKKSPHCCEVTCNKKRDWIDWATLVLEGIGLTVVIVYTVATIAIWCANKKAADAATVAAGAAETANRVASYSLTASQRAWAQMMDNTSPKEDKLKAKDIKHFSFPLRITNVGKTPAKKARVDAVVEIVKKGQDPTFVYSTVHDIVRTAVLFPGVSYEFEAFLRKNGVPVQPTPEEVKALDKGDMYIALYGMVNYEDDFGAHWTHYCWWKEFPTTMPFDMGTSCIQYNDVDQTQQASPK